MSQALFPSLPVQAKVGLAHGLLVLLTFGLIGWAAGRWAEERVLDLHVRQLDDSARRTAEWLDRSLFDRLREISSLAATVGPLTRGELERLQSTHASYAWIGVTDAAGIVTAATGGVLEGRDVSARPWWQQAASGPMVGDLHEARLLRDLLPAPGPNEPLRLLDVAAPLGPAAPQAGVLGAHLSWAWAAEIADLMASGADPGSQVEVRVIDAAGRDLHLSPTAPQDRPLRYDARAAANQPATEVDWSDGRRYLTAAVRRSGYRDFRGLGWTVLVRQPIALTVAPARELRRAIWAGGALAALLLVGLGWWSTARLMRPLRAVADAAQSELALLPTGGDEAARLSQALGNLVEQLRTRERQLVDLSAGLERRVVERTAELEQRNADLRGVVRMVSHDIRGPIASMAQALEMAARASPERQRHWLDVLARECAHVGEVVESLLSLSLSESRPLASDDTDMAALARAAVQRQRGLTGYAGEVEIGALPNVRGDAVMLGQVWDNLIGNAMKFSRLAEAPKIAVTARRVDRDWQFSVADNGIGFPPAEASRLFTAFERLTKDPHYPGTGLGLSIVQRVVARHGGQVAASSEPGRGAEFSFTLPVAEQGEVVA